MAAPTEILIFRDAKALAHYLAGALPRAPGLLGRACQAFTLASETPETAPLLAIQFDDARGTEDLVLVAEIKDPSADAAAREALVTEVKRAVFTVRGEGGTKNTSRP